MYIVLYKKISLRPIILSGLILVSKNLSRHCSFHFNFVKNIYYLILKKKFNRNEGFVIRQLVLLQKILNKEFKEQFLPNV